MPFGKFNSSVSGSLEQGDGDHGLGDKHLLRGRPRGLSKVEARKKIVPDQEDCVKENFD